MPARSQRSVCVCLWQAAELRAYLKGKGAEISEENNEGGLHVDLAQIIEACDVCLKEDDKGLLPEPPRVWLGGIIAISSFQ